MKTHGGKGTPQMIKWILSKFPILYPAMRYIEPYGGAASILLNKIQSWEEVYNDLDWNTYNVIKEIKIGSFTMCGQKYDETTFHYIKDSITTDDWSHAYKEYILRNMSRGGLKKDFAWSDRERGGQPGDVNAWINKTSQLPLIQHRLKDVILHNEDAINCLRRYNDQTSFAYLDPPYVKDTRTAKNIYNNEMTDEQHEELVEFLIKEWQGLYLLSGYRNKIYAKLPSWTIDKPVSNNSGQNKKKSKRTETLWANYFIT